MSTSRRFCPSSTACTPTSKTSTLRCWPSWKTTKAMDKDAEAELTAAIAAFKKSFA
jgi:hypothetical protein